MRSGTFILLPKKLANKKAIVNVKNRDNECLKRALKAARFPPPYGKNAQRPSKYPINNDLNREGIRFPTPLKDINNLEKQNPALAINVHGWENDNVIVHRISEKDKSIRRINLMLLHKDGNTHYCFVKRLPALLYDQTKHRNKKHFCEMCLTGFTTADILANHTRYCNGINRRPRKIEMPEEGKNILKFQNFNKQMKAPFVTYADFESRIEDIPRTGTTKQAAQKKQTNTRPVSLL